MGGVDRTRPAFVSYIERSRAYYLAQGDDNPYRWAHFESVPFTRLRQPLRACRVGLVTTAALHPPSPGGPVRGWKRAYAAAWDPTLPSLYTQDLSWDQVATHTDDRESYLPLQQLLDCAAAGRIGGVAARFCGVPTEYSQRLTSERDAPRVADWCREDGVDAALLVPL